MTCPLYFLRAVDLQLNMVSFLARSVLDQSETTVCLSILANLVMPKLVLLVSSAHIMWKCS